MEWTKVTLTTAGEKLLSGMLNGARLTFTRAELGDTAVKDELLPELTAVYSPISAPAFIAGREEIAGGKGTRVKFQIRNDGVQTPVQMRQVGIYAKSDHSDEVLFGILQSDVGEEIPSFEEFSQFEIKLYADFILGRTNNIKVIVSPAVYVTQDEFKEAIQAAGQIKYKTVGIYDRDPSKPDYLGGSEGGGEGENKVTLKARDYTGTADVAVILSDGAIYDAENMSRDPQSAENGSLIIKEV